MTLSRSLPSLLTSACLALLLGACASSPDSGAASDAAAPGDTAQTPQAIAPAAPAPGDTAAQCNATAAQSFVGQDASDATVAQAQTAAGATGAVRVIKPGQPVTMDFRADRLNVEVDEHNAIVKISCG